MKNLSVIVAWAFAAAFLGATVLGFIPNPLVGENALFVANAAHNLVHLATAIGFAVVARLGEKASIRFMQAFGAVYTVTGLIGFATLGSQAEGQLLGVIRINWLDNFLHLGLGIGIAAAAWMVQSRQRHLGVAQRA